MNLFCFSLEGSMDSLYEPAHNTLEYIIPSRSHSPEVLQEERKKWHVSAPAIPMECSQTCTTNSKKIKRKRKALVPKLASDNETEMGKDVRQAQSQTGEDRVPQVSSEEREKELSVQTAEADGETEVSMGTLKRIQKMVGGKKGSTEEGRGTAETTGHTLDLALKDDSPVMSCIGLAKKPEKKPGKEASQRVSKNNAAPPLDQTWGLGPHSERQSWVKPGEFSLPRDYCYHTCRRPEYRMYNYFTLPHSKDWNKFEYLFHDPRRELSPPRVVRSITGLDMWDLQRSTSFGRFDAFRNQPSPIMPEVNGGTLPVEGEPAFESCDQSKSGSIGQKMKAISMTMRKKMGRKYVKALSEEMVEGTDRDHEGEGDGEGESGRTLEKGSRRTSNSLESLNSSQSLSSGVTGGSDSSTNRDSLRLEDVPYTGHFCGRARVHTDFVPSPYDTDSLKLKVGDFIDVISKPPMGIWTGMLNNKVGTFKFIYVDVITEKEVEPKRIRPQRQSKHLAFKTLQELLESLHLEEYASSLLFNGYQTVEDLRDLTENHLIELNVTDPDHRQRLLAATGGDAETQDENEMENAPDSESRSDSVTLEKDCPRDSGCYATSESSDNGKEDAECHLNKPQAEP